MQLFNLDRLENIAGHLAKQGYAIDDHFLSHDEVGAILRVFEIHKEGDGFKKAGIGRSDDYQINRSIRGDYIKWIDPKLALPPIRVFLDKIHQLISYLNQTCFLGIRDYETHFTMYPKGSFYARHLDQFQGIGNRKVSFICYLNKNWTVENGGQLRLFSGENYKDILPLAGRLVCFVSSEVEHEVMVCYKTRYSLTGWMLNQPKELSFLH